MYALSLVRILCLKPPAFVEGRNTRESEQPLGLCDEPAGGDSMSTNSNRRLNPFNRSRQVHLFPTLWARRRTAAGGTDEKESGTITIGYQQLVAEASSAIETIPAAEAMKDLHAE